MLEKGAKLTEIQELLREFTSMHREISTGNGNTNHSWDVILEFWELAGLALVVATDAMKGDSLSPWYDPPEQQVHPACREHGKWVQCKDGHWSSSEAVGHCDQIRIQDWPTWTQLSHHCSSPQRSGGPPPRLGLYEEMGTSSCMGDASRSSWWNRNRKQKMMMMNKTKLSLYENLF